MSCDSGSEVIVTVKNCLLVQLLLEKLRPSSLAHLPPSTRLARTLTTFLIGTSLYLDSTSSLTSLSLGSGNDLFLEREVRPSLSALLTVFCSEIFQRSMDLSVPIPGLPAFQEL